MGWINIVVGIIVAIYSFQYAFNKQMVVKHPLTKEKYVCNNNLSFMIFSVLTAMVFLGPYSLVKYAVWIIIMILMCITGRMQIKWNGILSVYGLFILWNLYTMTYTPYPFQGWMMIIKFCLPILYYFLGYNAINSKDDYIVFLTKSSWYLLIYSIIIGGFTSKFFLSFYVFLCYTTEALFIANAAIADFFAILVSVPLTLLFITKKKKYFLLIIWLLLSSVFDTVRTGIGGLCIGVCLYLLMYKKIKSIPYIASIVILVLVIVFSVPEVRKKTFGIDSDYVTLSTATSDDIKMHGRDSMWDDIKRNFYYGHELTGSGCGAALGWLKEINKDEGLVQIHSDWVQMMAESGNIGMTLFIAFGVFVLFKVISTTFSNRKSLLTTMIGASVVASFGACFFAMSFDNILAYSQQGFVFPFMLMGIFYKSIDLQL